MNNSKSYPVDDKQLETSLLQSLYGFDCGIDEKFGLEKCSKTILKKGEIFFFKYKRIEHRKKKKEKQR